MSQVLGTKSALLLSAGLAGFALWYGHRQGGGGAMVGYARPLTLREVNSPEVEPGDGGRVSRAYSGEQLWNPRQTVRLPYIDESPGNPNQNGGERVDPNHLGVQRQQSSGLL